MRHRKSIGALVLCAFAVLFSVSSAQDVNDQSTTANDIFARTTLKRISEAKEICERQTPSFTTEVTVTTSKKVTWKKVKGQKKPQRVVVEKRERHETVTERPVVLCAFKASDETWHVINIHVPYPRPAGAFQFRTLTPDYRLEHIQGVGVTRLTFNAYHKEEGLVIYRYLHSWFSSASLEKGNGPHLVEDAQFVSYTPYHPDYFDPLLLEMGMQYLYGELKEAYRELREARVPSKVFPQALLSDVIDWRIPFNLAANEQMDHDKFNSDPHSATANVYIEYALNGPESFSWSYSRAGAIGAMQFTNHVGTYDGVRAAYPRAGLDHDFVRGSRTLRNALKAAICLLDLELSRLPFEVHALSRTNPGIAGVYPVIAYNAGPSRAKAAYEALARNAIDLETADLGLPEQIFVRDKVCASCKTRRSIVNVLPRETEMYVRKYIYVLNFIEQFRAQGTLP